MDDINAIKSKSVQGVVSYTFRTGIVHVIALIALAILSAILSPEEYGVFFVVTSIISLLTFVSDVGLASSLIQKKNTPTTAELRTIFTFQQILAVMIFLLIIGLTPFWKEFTHLNQQGLWLLYVLGFSFILATFKTIPSILLERELDFHKLALPQIVEQLVFYGVTIILVVRGYGITGFTIGALARSVAGLIIIYSLKRWPIGYQFDRAALKNLLRFGIKFQLNDLLARLKDDLYFIVLAKILPAAEIGYIGQSRRLSSIPYQFSVQNIIAITFPIYSRLQDQKTYLAKAVEKSIFFISIFIFPVLMGMSVLAWPVTVVFPIYSKWQPAIPSLVLFCVNIAFSSVTSPLTNTLNAVGKINHTLRLMIIWTTLTWVLTPMAIRIWGYIGVAVVAMLVSCTSVIAIWWVKRILPINYLTNLWRQILATGVMGVILIIGIPYWSRSFWWLIAGILIGAAVYTLTVLAVGFEKIKSEVVSLKRS